MRLQPTFRRSVLLVLLLITLGFGWWPLTFLPKNDVAYVPEDSAWGFNTKYAAGDIASRGVAYYKQELDTRAWPGITIRAVLKGQPRGGGLGVFMEFYENQGEVLPALLISKWQNHLAIRSRRDTAVVDRGYSEIGRRKIFAGGKFVELVVCSEGDRTHVYVNGAIAETRSDFPLLGADNAFVGSLAIGNNADGTKPFNGEIRSIEIYDDFFKPGSPELAAATPVVNFDLSSAVLPPDIVVPEYFDPAKRQFLNPLKKNVDKAGYQRDVVINSLGFIPIGICFAAVARRRVRSFMGVLFCVCLASFTLSLTIELGQVYMVHRDSSQLDVLLNTLSGCVAVIVPRRWILFL